MLHRRYFGLDLSGYSGGNSGLAEISTTDAGGLLATIYRNHPFGRKAHGRDMLSNVIPDERLALKRLCKSGPIFVDVPIQLKDLVFPKSPLFLWELTARPVDFAYGGLRPLAERIGAAVARFRHLLAEEAISNINETYPAASLAASDMPSKKYKGMKADWKSEDTGWTGGVLAKVAIAMKLVPETPLEVSADEIDAVVCAYAGAAPDCDRLSGQKLIDDVHDRITRKVRVRDRVHIKALQVPSNYKLFSSPPRQNIGLRVRSWEALDA